MEALFKLKEVPYNAENWMTNEQAEDAYKRGSLPYSTEWGSGARRVACGFYSEELPFHEWCRRYHVTIIGSEAI